MDHRQQGRQEDQRVPNEFGSLYPRTIFLKHVALSTSVIPNNSLKSMADGTGHAIPERALAHWQNSGRVRPIPLLQTVTHCYVCWASKQAFNLLTVTASIPRARTGRSPAGDAQGRRYN